MYEQTDGGVLVKKGLMARGRYHVFIDGEHVETKDNLIPKEGLLYLLKTGILGGAAQTNFYVAVFSGNVNPNTNWTGANFKTNATEIDNPSEGYSNATRPQWVPDTSTPANPVVGNLNSKATFDIACSSSLNISGAALLTDNTKGGTGGLLISAVRFTNVHTVNNGSTFQLGYEVELVDV